jgi:hypothetical protein
VKVVRDAVRRDRIIVAVPFSSKAMARAVREKIGFGRVRAGTIEAEGGDVPFIMRQLGAPQAIWDAALAYAEAATACVGRRREPQDDENLTASVERFEEAYRAAL